MIFGAGKPGPQRTLHSGFKVLPRGAPPNNPEYLRIKDSFRPRSVAALRIGQRRGFADVDPVSLSRLHPLQNIRILLRQVHTASFVFHGTKIFGDGRNRFFDGERRGREIRDQVPALFQRNRRRAEGVPVACAFLKPLDLATRPLGKCAVPTRCPDTFLRFCNHPYVLNG